MKSGYFIALMSLFLLPSLLNGQVPVVVNDTIDITPDFPVKHFAQADYWSNLVYFGGCPVNHIPKGIGIPDRNPKARAVINAIIAGYTYSELKSKLPDSLDEILDQLSRGKVISLEKERIALLFPVVTGEKRELIRSLIQKRLLEQSPAIDSLIRPLREHLREHPRLVFHFLWSRIIDNTFWNQYNSEFHTEEGPPSIAWIIYPPHPFQCGTNYDQTTDNSQIAISWSYNIFDEFFSLPSTASFYRLTQNEPVPEGDREFFKKYGLMDTARVSMLFTYRDGDRLDLLCDSLKQVYARKLRGLFDYRSLSKTFDIPAAELFLIMAHETAYTLFQQLSVTRPDFFLPILRESNPDRNLSFLCSFRLK